MGRRLLWVAVLITAHMMTGCGQKGPLYRDTGQATAPMMQVPPASVGSQENDEQRRSGS